MSELFQYINIDVVRLEWLAATQATAVMGTVLAILLIVHILRKPHMQAASVGWIVIIIAVPLLGIPLYLTFGQRKLAAKINRKVKINTGRITARNDNPTDTLLSSLGLPPSSAHNTVAFDKDGQAAFVNLAAMLESAEHTIDVAMFIFANDRVGRELMGILARKAAAGVKVRLLLDGVGSFSFSKRWLQPALQSGVDIAWFIPVLHHPLRGKTNLRNHRKIVITDGGSVWSGGRNFSETYLGPNTSDTRWIDLSYRISGPAVDVFAGIFETDWQFTHGVDVTLPAETPEIPGPPLSRVQVIPSGPDLDGDPIYATFLTSCYNAKKRIIIVTPYYVPDQGVQEALRLASLRGVEVDLVLPKKSNHKFADIARRRALRELYRARVRIWLIPDKMVHAKVMVVDDNYATAGSANLDIRSMFLNCEVISGFYSPQDIQWLESWAKDLRRSCEQYRLVKAGAVAQTIEGLVLLGGYQL